MLASRFWTIGALALAWAPAQPEPPFQISVQVDLVVLPVTVRDQAGRLADHLRAEDFTIREEDVPQTLRLFRHEDSPLTVGLVVDHSGSMRRKLPDVIAAVRLFLEASRGDDEVFLLNFNERVTLDQPLQPAAAHPQQDIPAALLRRPAEGQTALYDAVLAGFTEMRGARFEKKALVVISDGGDNASAQSLAQVLEAARRLNVMVYTVGMFGPNDPDRNPGVLKQLARATGGEAYFPSQPSQIRAVCERIAQDLRHQYVLGYLSTGGAPGQYRRVRVSAPRGFTVRARAGFVSAGGASR